MYYYLFTNNTLSPTLSLKSPENFGKFNDREVPVSATFVKSLSQAAASKLSLQFWTKIPKNGYCDAVVKQVRLAVSIVL